MRLPSLPSSMTAMKEVPPQAVAFRVLFSDGDQEINIGEVAVDPGLAFRKLQFRISDMIGVSPHQITLFLVRQKKARPSPEARRKILIDEGTDFSALVRERDCAVLAQLKRTRKDRRSRARRNHAVGGGGGGGEEFFALEKKRTPLPEKTILRRPAEFYRGGPAMAAMIPASGVAEDGVGLMGLFNYEGLMNLQLRRERYLLSTAAMAYNSYAGASVLPPHAGGSPRVAGHGNGLLDAAGPALCAMCAAAREKPAPFHCCVYDRVVAEGFRSSVGPIERPSRARVQLAP